MPGGLYPVWLAVECGNVFDSRARGGCFGIVYRRRLLCLHRRGRWLCWIRGGLCRTLCFARRIQRCGCRQAGSSDCCRLCWRCLRVLRCNHGRSRERARFFSMHINDEPPGIRQQKRRILTDIADIEHNARHVVRKLGDTNAFEKSIVSNFLRFTDQLRRKFYTMQIEEDAIRSRHTRCLVLHLVLKIDGDTRINGCRPVTKTGDERQLSLSRRWRRRVHRRFAEFAPIGSWLLPGWRCRGNWSRWLWFGLLRL
jgi:hypothetical protein